MSAAAGRPPDGSGPDRPEQTSGGDPSQPWYRRWFGDEYLQLYPHRDEDEARAGVRLFLVHAELPPRAAVLDLACGAGRHLRSMREAGLDPVGLDLSLPLLRAARDEHRGERVVRSDMRALPFASGSFPAVTSFFTSVGYFEDERDDARVLGEIRRVLRPGGLLFLDFLNAALVRDRLRPRDEDEMEGRRVVQERRLIDDGRSVHKTIRLEGTDDSPPQVFHERVRLYTPADLGELLSGQGFRAVHRFGDYDGASLEPSSPRVIILARAR